MALWDEVKSNLVEWYTFTSDKTTEAARIGSRKWDKFGISRDIERQFSELGSLVYSGMREDQEDILSGEPVLELIRRIEVLEKELSSKGQEIHDIKAEYAKAASAGGADTTTEPATEGPQSVTETVLKDPVLDVGSGDSAILVEPVIEVSTETPDSELSETDSDELKENRE